jgi:anti-sigma-K factor RskA
MSDSDFTTSDERDALAALECLLPRVTPPHDLFDRILAEVRPEAAVVPLRPVSRRRALAPIVAVAAVAAVAVVAIAITAGGDGLGSPDARAAISGRSEAAVSGEATLYGEAQAGGKVLVSLSDVPPVPSGHHYEIWVLRDGSAEMEAVGTFTPASRNVRLELPLPGPGRYAALDISVEENGGSPAHSDTSLAGGTFS